jgi:Uma2 family endonuclease
MTVATAVLPLTIPVTHLQLSPGNSVTIAPLTWAEFEQLLVEFGDDRRLRLTFYQGNLELRMPLDDHEVFIRMLDRIIGEMCAELGLNLKTIGSTTLKIPSLASGAEPDNCFYIQNEPKVRGQRINLTKIPAPDLVVEVETTYKNPNKQRMYAQMGVAEFWSCDRAGKLTFRVLDSSELEPQYREVEVSPTFPLLRSITLQKFVDRCNQDGEIPAMLQFREWIQQQQQGSASLNDLFQ